MAKKKRKSTPKKPALGRGLSALLPKAAPPREQQAGTGRIEISVDRLEVNPHQPRTRFDEQKLAELTASVKQSGIIQPIVVTPQGDRYRIIAGERRFRAAQGAGLEKVPVVVQEVGSDRELVVLALVENLQRADLNPIEEAEAFDKLRTDFSLSQEEIATRVGRNRSSVANTLRLLKLPDDLQEMVRSGRLTAGHAKAILGLEKRNDQIRLAEEVVDQGLSVRETEQWVASRPDQDAPPESPPARKPRVNEKDVFTRNAEDQLASHLRLPVEIVRRGRRGEVRLRFSNEDELIRIHDLLMGAREGSVQEGRR